jgi:predicted nucleic acid-binding protein
MPKRRKTKPTGRTATQFVLDCSTTLAWHYADEANDYSDRVAASFSHASAIVPGIWLYEVANALIVGERRRRVTEQQTAAILQSLGPLPISIAPLSTETIWQDAFALARGHGLSVYDAAYLHLCVREQLPLATLDSRMMSAAEALGVARYDP